MVAGTKDSVIYSFSHSQFEKHHKTRRNTEKCLAIISKAAFTRFLFLFAKYMYMYKQIENARCRTYTHVSDVYQSFGACHFPSSLKNRSYIIFPKGHDSCPESFPFYDRLDINKSHSFQKERNTQYSSVKEDFSLISAMRVRVQARYLITTETLICIRVARFAERKILCIRKPAP